MKKYLLFFLLIQSFFLFAQILPGAYQTNEYLPLLKDKNIGVVANQSSLIGHTHLIDSLLSLNIKITKVFAPEHGFRGDAEAGESVSDMVDEKTGIQIISIYGKTSKPSKENLTDLDILIFDIQDVGVRFFTYISTLHYVMEACAENGVPLLVLDRPNPNGFYIDGPIMQEEYTSFIGMHPVPIVYGMTIGEYAKMINGEGWLKNEIKCDLTVIPCKNYTHDSFYTLPVKPSPNLPTMRSVYLYPSIALFEGTIVSEGRGTESPFEIFGHPDFKGSDFSFIPKSIPGMSTNPKLKGKVCYGIDLRDTSLDFLMGKNQIQLEWLLLAYRSIDTDNFFIPFFENLAGTEQLKRQIKNQMSASEIRSTWKKSLNDFRQIREKYLIYP